MDILEHGSFGGHLSRFIYGFVSGIKQKDHSLFGYIGFDCFSDNRNRLFLFVSAPSSFKRSSGVSKQS
jgi:hypothetical protein